MIPSNPIPQVPNYGSSAQYRDLPSEEQIRAGVIPLDSLPAAWWNAMWFCTNGAVNEARSAVGTLITEVCNAITGAGICINESCVDQLYQAIETIRQRVGNAITAGAVKSSSNCGEVSIDANGIMTANGVGNAAQLTTSAHTVVGAINELKTTYDCCFSDLSGCIGSVDNSKAPTNHVSSAATYGVGNADCYGHLKISDTYDSCIGAAADGIAASQQALYCVYNAIQAAASLGNTDACPLANVAGPGYCTTAARSDHEHPLPDIFQIRGECLVLGTTVPTTSAGIILANGHCCQGKMICFLNNVNDTYGNGYSIGSGGIGILGAGEAANALWTNLNGSAELYGPAASCETLYLASDGAICFYANVQAGVASAAKSYIGTDGYYHGNICGNLCGTAYSANYASGAGYADSANYATGAGAACVSCCTNATCWTGGVVCFYTSGGTLCVCNSASNGVIAIPDASQMNCSLFKNMIHNLGMSPVMWLGGRESRCLGYHSCMSGVGSVSVKGLNVW